MKNAIIYTRYQHAHSHDDPQRVACEAYAKQHGYEVSALITEDGIVQGENVQRLTLSLIKQLADDKAFDVLLLHTFDRISRDACTCFTYLDALDDCGIEIVSVHEGNFRECLSRPARMIQEAIRQFMFGDAAL